MSNVIVDVNGVVTVGRADVTDDGAVYDLLYVTLMNNVPGGKYVCPSVCLLALTYLCAQYNIGHACHVCYFFMLCNAGDASAFLS